MKKTIRLLALCGLLMITGVSCANFSSNTPLPSVTAKISPNWWTSWLTNPVCKPPCWQNITPGKATFDEAISILENTPGIKITFKSNDGVDWDFSQDEGGTLSSSQDGIVRMIWVGSVADKKLPLKSIVASYGFPQYVKPYDCREGMCSTALLYPDLGMFLSVFVKNNGIDHDHPQIEVLPDTTINRVYFIEVGRGSFLNLFRLPESEFLFDWKGYRKYP